MWKFYNQIYKKYIHVQNLSKIDDDADKFGISFVKNSERAVAKKYGVSHFPTLVYLRNGEPVLYGGDLMNEEQVLEWLTSVESMDLPDKIEEVNSKNLQAVISDHDYVAVLFCEWDNSILIYNFDN